MQLWKGGKGRVPARILTAVALVASLGLAAVLDTASRPSDALRATRLPTSSPSISPTLPRSSSPTSIASRPHLRVVSSPRPTQPSFRASATGINVWPAISGDARHIAFQSNARLAPVNGRDDQIYLYDSITKTVRLVSASPGGAPGNRWSTYPSISDNGRYVAYCSAVSNLVPGDTNDDADVFLWDRVTRTTTRVSVGLSGTQANGDSCSGAHALSASGRTVAFASTAWNLVAGDTNGVRDVFTRDLATGETRLVSRTSLALGNGPSGNAAISADGAVVAFDSFAYNLTSDDAPPAPQAYPSNAGQDVFVADLRSNEMERIPLPPPEPDTDHTPEAEDVEDFADRPSLSPDGRHVAFRANVGQHRRLWRAVYVRDRARHETIMLAVACRTATMGEEYSNCGHGDAAFATHTNVMAFSSETDPPGTRFAGQGGVFVLDLSDSADPVVLASVDGQGKSMNASRPSISADGNVVAFDSWLHEFDHWPSCGNGYSGGKEGAQGTCYYLYARDLAAETTRRVT